MQKTPGALRRENAKSCASPSSPRNGHAVVAGGASACEPRRMTARGPSFETPRYARLLRMTVAYAATPAPRPPAGRRVGGANK